MLTLTSAALLILHTLVLSGTYDWALAALLPSMLRSSHFGHFWLLQGTMLGALWLCWTGEQCGGSGRH